MRLEWNHPFTLASHLTQLGFNPRHGEKGDFVFLCTYFEGIFHPKCSWTMFSVSVFVVLSDLIGKLLPWGRRTTVKPVWVFTDAQAIKFIVGGARNRISINTFPRVQYEGLRHFFHTQAIGKRKYHWKTLEMFFCSGCGWQDGGEHSGEDTKHDNSVTHQMQNRALRDVFKDTASAAA